MIFFESFAKTFWLILAANVLKSFVCLLHLHISKNLLKKSRTKNYKSGLVFTSALTELQSPLSAQPLMDFIWSLLRTIWNFEDLGQEGGKSLQVQKGWRVGSREAERLLSESALPYSTWAVPEEQLCSQGCATLLASQGQMKDARSWK